jgi:hypothetical protein
MRRRTRNVTLAILGVVALLLALGALPGLVRSGDPYVVVASPDGDHAAVDVTNLSTQRYPYVSAALANASAATTGRSARYWRGPFGFKEGFTHSPFDEFDALGGRQPNATADGDVYVRTDDGTFRLSIAQERDS